MKDSSYLLASSYLETRLINDYGPCTLKIVSNVLQAGKLQNLILFMCQFIKLQSQGGPVLMLVTTGRNSFICGLLVFLAIWRLFFMSICFQNKRLFQDDTYLMVFLRKFFSKRTGYFFSFTLKMIISGITPELYNSLYYTVLGS